MSAKGSILVIDDETEIRESLEPLLRLEGYKADSASTGPAACSDEVTPSAATDSAAPSIAAQRVRGVIEELRRCAALCAPGYFFSRATPRIKATVHV